MKADLHVHSSFSHDVPSIPEFSPRALYDRAVERGMGFFTLTDHDTMEGIEDLRRSRRTACTESVRAALDLAMASAGPEDLICIAGSLYLVGQARLLLRGELAGE